MSTMPYFKLKNKTKQKSFFEKLFCSNKSRVKPITKNNLIKKDYSKEYYQKYGIIYTGSDLGSCVNSLF